jgi:hypothetical protein
MGAAADAMELDLAAAPIGGSTLGYHGGGRHSS